MALEKRYRLNFKGVFGRTIVADTCAFRMVATSSEIHLVSQLENQIVSN